jgi:hypothetical protein
MHKFSACLLLKADKVPFKKLDFISRLSDIPWLYRKFEAFFVTYKFWQKVWMHNILVSYTDDGAVGDWNMVEMNTAW